MPVPSDPTLRNVQAEYGGSGTLREYVRGGVLVPIDSSASISTNASELTLRQFAGTSLPISEIVNLTNQLVESQRTSYNDGPSSAFARLTLNLSGSLTLLGSTAYNSGFNSTGFIEINGVDYWQETPTGSSSGEIPIANQWLQSGTPSLYSAQFTVLTQGGVGATASLSGTFNTWLALTSDRSVSVSAFSSTLNRLSTKSVTFRIDIALTSNLSNILATCNTTLVATAQSQVGDIP